LLCNQVKSRQNHISGNATHQAFNPELDKIGL
jgi:hypothetical protein